MLLLLLQTDPQALSNQTYTEHHGTTAQTRLECE